MTFVRVFSFRYDLHSGVSDTVGNHDDIATCIGYCDETCKLMLSSSVIQFRIMLWSSFEVNLLVNFRLSLFLEPQGQGKLVLCVLGILMNGEKDVLFPLMGF